MVVALRRWRRRTRCRNLVKSGKKRKRCWGDVARLSAPTNWAPCPASLCTFAPRVPSMATKAREYVWHVRASATKDMTSWRSTPREISRVIVATHYSPATPASWNHRKRKPIPVCCCSAYYYFCDSRNDIEISTIQLFFQFSFRRDFEYLLKN